MFRVSRKFNNTELAHRRRLTHSQDSQDNKKHPANGVMRLQRSLGNQIVHRLINSGHIMAKLIIGRQNDSWEREADQVADRVVQKPEQDFQRQTEPEEEEEVLQPQSISSGIKPIVQKQDLDEDEEVQKQAEPEDEEQIQAQEVEEEEESIQSKERSEPRRRDTSNFADRLLSLKGRGNPLPESVQTSFENRFGHDFSGVRTHSGTEASDLAKSINAKAFTSGKDVIFGAGQYSTESSQGKRLLAHELTHVLQQRQSHKTPRGRSDCGVPSIQMQAPEGVVQRLAQHAERILSLAQDQRRDLGRRAVQVVRRIIRQYYPAEASKVREVIYQEDVEGLEVDTRSYRPRTGGANATANLLVGRYFIEHTNRRHFARRVMQVRHELEHINQVRAGMGDPIRPAEFRRRRDEREFLAHYQTVVLSPPPGTGRISHANLVRIIDAAIGHYNCLDRGLQRRYRNQKQELLRKRPEEIRRSGRPRSFFGDRPRSCRRS